VRTNTIETCRDKFGRHVNLAVVGYARTGRLSYLGVHDSSPSWEQRIFIDRLRSTASDAGRTTGDRVVAAATGQTDWPTVSLRRTTRRLALERQLGRFSPRRFSRH
jgi:hypothetical protein